MPTTANYSWPTPADTDLVKDGALAIRDLGDAIDSTVFANSPGLVHINTTAFSGATAHSFGSNASPIFTSNYTNYRIILDDLIAASSTVAVTFRLRANTTDLSTSVYDRQILQGQGTTVTANRLASQTSANFGDIGSSNKNAILLELQNPETAKQATFSSIATFLATNDIYLQTFTGIVKDTGQYNGFTILSTVNFSGTISVYGYRK